MGIIDLNFCAQPVAKWYFLGSYLLLHESNIPYNYLIMSSDMFFGPKLHKPMIAMLEANIGRQGKMYGHWRPRFLESPPKVIFNVQIQKTPQNLGPKCYKATLVVISPTSKIRNRGQIVWLVATMFFGCPPIIKINFKIHQDPNKIWIKMP